MESVRVSAAPLNLPTPHDDSGAVLDAEEAPNERSWHHFGTTSESGAPDVSEAPDFDGGPSRTRTVDPLIKSDPASIYTEVHDDVKLEDLYTRD